MAGYTIIKTQDGSPTLEFKSQHQEIVPELMHHSGGAYSETQYIYGSAVRLGIQQSASRVVSVGLGLGYNEILVAEEAYKHQKIIKIESFESDPILSEHFLECIQNEVFEEVYQSVLNHFQFPNEAKLFLRESYSNQNWVIDAGVSGDKLPKNSPEIVLYDAFSNKTTPELWDLEFLKLFLSRCDSNCIFATYACRSTLKVALKESGFQVQVKPGFQGKRNCTLAVRGKFSFLED